MSAPAVADLYVLNTRGFGSHQAMAELVGPGSTVLDVGCAGGLFGQLLGSTKGCTVTGLEADPSAAEVAGTRLPAVVCGDAGDPEVLQQLAQLGPFDHLVLGDVLEHLVDPEAALTSLLPLLAPGGTAVVSLPNIVSARARLRLALGIWRYEDNGIFDRTHLRFFSVPGARRLLTEAGLSIVQELPVGPLTHRLGRRAVAVNRWRPGLLATQVVFAARR